MTLKDILEKFLKDSEKVPQIRAKTARLITLDDQPLFMFANVGF